MTGDAKLHPHNFYVTRDIDLILVSFHMFSGTASSMEPLPTSRSVRFQREMEKNHLENWKNLDSNYSARGERIRTNLMPKPMVLRSPDSTELVPTISNVDRVRVWKNVDS